MTDDNKPLPQTYLKVSQTAVTMFGPRQFNRKSGGAEEHKHYLAPPTLPFHLGDEGWGVGGRREEEAVEEGGFSCKRGQVGRRRVALHPLCPKNCFRA